MTRPLFNLLKRMWSGAGLAPSIMIFKLLKGVSFMHQSWICQILRPFSVVCDASDFAIDSDLFQTDNDGRERVIAFESRQLKAAKKELHGS